MSTYAQWLQKAAEKLSNSDSAQLDAEILLAHCLKKDRSYFYTWPDKNLSSDEKQQADGLLQKRINGEPIAYIMGEKDFWSLALTINKSVLIPRPETELLVEQVLSKKLKPNAKVLDLGTGSGAIILALAKENPQWECVACDQSIKALDVAKTNAIKNQINNVKFIHSNWLDKLNDKNFDLIVSNPPYIDKADNHLKEGDVRFEPRSALVANDKGLADIQIIAKQAKAYLKPQGWLLLEHGYTQAEAVREILAEQNYVNIETHRDLAGLERVTCGKVM